MPRYCIHIDEYRRTDGSVVEAHKRCYEGRALSDDETSKISGFIEALGLRFTTGALEVPEGEIRETSNMLSEIKELNRELSQAEPVPPQWQEEAITLEDVSDDFNSVVGSSTPKTGLYAFDGFRFESFDAVVSGDYNEGVLYNALTTTRGGQYIQKHLELQGVLADQFKGLGVQGNMIEPLDIFHISPSAKTGGNHIYTSRGVEVVSDTGRFESFVKTFYNAKNNYAKGLIKDVKQGMLARKYLEIDSPRNQISIDVLQDKISGGQAAAKELVEMAEAALGKGLAEADPALLKKATADEETVNKESYRLMLARYAHMFQVANGQYAPIADLEKRAKRMIDRMKDFKDVFNGYGEAMGGSANAVEIRKARRAERVKKYVDAQVKRVVGFAPDLVFHHQIQSDLITVKLDQVLDNVRAISSAAPERSADVIIEEGAFPLILKEDGSFFDINHNVNLSALYFAGGAEEVPAIKEEDAVNFYETKISDSLLDIQNQREKFEREVLDRSKKFQESYPDLTPVDMKVIQDSYGTGYTSFSGKEYSSEAVRDIREQLFAVDSIANKHSLRISNVNDRIKEYRKKVNSIKITPTRSPSWAGGKKSYTEKELTLISEFADKYYNATKGMDIDLDHFDVLELTGALVEGEELEIINFEKGYVSPETINLSVRTEFGSRSRTISLAEKMVYNNSFSLVSSAPAGSGTRATAGQVAALERLGFFAIKTEAGGSKNSNSNGYYTWARLGFYTTEDIVLAGLNAESFDELLSTEEGRERWKEYGSDYSAIFYTSHYHPDALPEKVKRSSTARLEEYLRQKGMNDKLEYNA